MLSHRWLWWTHGRSWHWTTCHAIMLGRSWHLARVTNRLSIVLLLLRYSKRIGLCSGGPKRISYWLWSTLWLAIRLGWESIRCGQVEFILGSHRCRVKTLICKLKQNERLEFTLVCQSTPLNQKYCAWELTPGNTLLPCRCLRELLY